MFAPLAPFWDWTGNSSLQFLAPGTASPLAGALSPAHTSAIASIHYNHPLGMCCQFPARISPTQLSILILHTRTLRPREGRGFSLERLEPAPRGLAPGLLLFTVCEGAQGGVTLPASRHLCAEEEERPGVGPLGFRTPEPGGFPLKRPKLAVGGNHSFFCDQWEGQQQIL